MSNIVVPQLGESVVEARVARWLKKEGDRVQTGEPVVELETEKVDLEVGADQSGVISSIKHKEGDEVKVGEVLAVVDTSAAEAPTKPATEKASSATPASQPRPEPARATPTARRMAREQDVQSSRAPTSVTTVAPTSDSAGAPTSDSAIAPREDRVRMSKRRQTIARRLVESQRTAATLTTFNEVDMTTIAAIRERHKEAFKKHFGVNLGITAFFVKAAVAALHEFPHLNAEIQGDEIVIKHHYDIGVAVDAEGGLVVPVLRGADQMSFPQIELAIRDFAARAASNTLTLQDLMGGTFTVTNGGVFGSLLSTPILNPPQVGILGLHKIQERPVSINREVSVRPMMYMALSYDHRIVDGREAVQFLVRVKEFVEDPAHLLLVS